MMLTIILSGFKSEATTTQSFEGHPGQSFPSTAQTARMSPALPWNAALIQPIGQCFKPQGHGIRNGPQSPFRRAELFSWAQRRRRYEGKRREYTRHGMLDIYIQEGDVGFRGEVQFADWLPVKVGHELLHVGGTSAITEGLGGKELGFLARRACRVRSTKKIGLHRQWNGKLESADI